MNLKARIETLEAEMIANKEHVPALIYWGQQETFDQVRERYKMEHGFDLPVDAPVIRLVAVDASKEGNNRELSSEEFKENRAVDCG